MGGSTSPIPQHDMKLIGMRIDLGNYRVQKKLGEGGMGEVYLLRHGYLPDTRLALKVMKLPLDCDDLQRRHMLQRFTQEAMAAAAVESSYVARPLDFGQLPDGRQYIVYEYVGDRSLDDELERAGVLPLRTALLIAIQVADAMARAHRRAVIHRDLTPSNIMLIDDVFGPHVKILDFGIARASGELRLASTQPGMVVGTPGYRSPEALAGEIVDGRSDIFTLGVVLYEMLTGKLPYKPRSQKSRWEDHTKRPAEISALRPDHCDPVPEGVDRIVRRALAPDTLRRYQSMEEIRDELLRELGCLTGMAAIAQPVSLARELAASCRPEAVPTAVERMGGRCSPPAVAASAPPARPARPNHLRLVPLGPRSRLRLLKATPYALCVAAVVIAWLAWKLWHAARGAEPVSPSEVSLDVEPMGHGLRWVMRNGIRGLSLLRRSQTAYIDI